MKAKFIFAIVCFTFVTVALSQDKKKEEKVPATTVEENSAAAAAGKGPEIVYIHYSTPEEAEIARKQILAQYEALGGTATIVEEEAANLSALLNEDAITGSADDKSKPASTTPVAAGGKSKSSEKFLFAVKKNK